MIWVGRCNSKFLRNLGFVKNLGCLSHGMPQPVSSHHVLSSWSFCIPNFKGLSTSEKLLNTACTMQNRVSLCLGYMYTASSAETCNRSLGRSCCKTYSTLLVMVFLNLNCKYRASSLRLRMVQASNRSLVVLLISKLHLAS